MKRKSLVILLALFGVTLTSCFANEVRFQPYSNYVEVQDNMKDITTDSYYKLAKYKDLEYKDLSNLDKTKSITSFRDVFSSSNNGRTYLNMPSCGEQNILVLPVGFLDSDKSTYPEKQIHIQNACFGLETTTVNESLASYYNKVSYGHLKLKGEVGEFYTLDKTAQQIENGELGNKIAATRKITSLAVENYRKNHEDDILKYDNDKDGYLDGVLIIYDHHFGDRQDSLWWAYVDQIIRNETDYQGQRYNNIAPYASMYGWISYDFLEVKHNICDAHVFIHEMGHIFGLQDYYSDNDFQPVGFMDMMDYNLGDHNAFSKMLLNWTSPYVITNDCTLDIKPSIQNGDCILIPSGTWNGTPYDEFLLLEFYAPEGVNYLDSLLTFSYKDANNNAQTGNLFTNYGIKVYHVDSRLGYIENKLNPRTLITLFDSPTLEQDALAYKDLCFKPREEGGRGYGYVKYCIDFAFNNNMAHHPYIQLLEASGTNSFQDHKCATNNTLFQKGDDFGINTFKDFTFYDGMKLPFNFKVLDVTPNHARIQFQKIH